ncbi:hypothetical protein CVT24_001974 [Panaeolus cyanescens]|uniref:Uncharacterized protein n=1 Tax=Panaeolus cyanescens TaxID=181874 RepID=A0A409YHM8_9AGAR|nr:hypothetical protein CVT24_001974 [Panaeolus cyanescens]
MSNELIIDDNDRRFTYKGLWEVLRSSTDEQWSRTAHSTWEWDATASLSFTGTQIKVYGTVPAGRGTSAVDFAIDGMNGERVWHTSGSTTLYNVLFYDSGPLGSGSHTIVMSNKGEDNDMDFRLDRVVISLDEPAPPPQTPAPPASTPPVPTPAPSTSSTPAPALTASSSLTAGSPSASRSRSLLSGSLSVSDQSSLPNSSPSLTSGHSLTTGNSLTSGIISPDQTSAPGANIPQATETVIIAKEKSDTPIIVGSVVGVVAFLAIIGALLFLHVRRGRYNNRIPDSPEKQSQPNLPRSSFVVPFTTPPATGDFNQPLGTSFTTKNTPPTRTNRNEDASNTLSYVDSAGSGENGSTINTHSPITTSPTNGSSHILSEKKNTLLNSSTSTHFEPAFGLTLHTLERPPSYAPTPTFTCSGPERNH